MSLLGMLLLIPALSFGNITDRTDTLQRPGLLSYINGSGKTEPVRTLGEWQIKRRQILDSMQAAMGPLPARSGLPPMEIRYLDSVKGFGYVRYSIRFTVAKGEVLPAYLYIPVQKGKKKKLPAMLALHPTGTLGKKIVDGQSSVQNRAYARELAQRGYVVIAPDYPGFGDLIDYNFEADRYVSGTMKNIFDDMRCVDLLQSRADVDPERIGVIGHSLGGHSALFVAAFDKRLKVVVSSCGWTLMHYYFNGDTLSAQKNGGKLWPWAQERYMPLIRTKYNLDPDKVPFDFDEVIAAIAPRAFFSNSPLFDANFNVNGVEIGMKRISEVYHFLGAKNALAVRYPSSKHDFPSNVRLQAYQFVDSVFDFDPMVEKHYSYLDNPQYLERVKLFATQKDQKSIVMLGNSITERGQWPEILGRTDVANRGIGSDITAGYINRINYVFNLHPEICFIEGGVNDLAHYIAQDTIIHNLGILIDTLRSKKIIPVLNAVTFVTSEYKAFDPGIFNARIEKLNEAIKRLADKKKVAFINLNPKISSNELLVKKFAVKDGIHYTSTAYLVWENEIMKILAKEGI
jgi:lysophospholipase L1-like esterase/acetyl esterase/lipase